MSKKKFINFQPNITFMPFKWCHWNGEIFASAHFYRQRFDDDDVDGNGGAMGNRSVRVLCSLIIAIHLIVIW